MEREKGFEAGKIIKSAAFIITVMVLLCSGGCSKQFARLEANQAQLKSMSQTNAEQLAIIAQYIERNQAELTEQIQKLHNEMQVALDNQQVLNAGLVVSHNEAAKIAGNVTLLEQKQTELYNTVQSNNTKLNEKVALLEQNQNTILAGITDSRNQTLKVSTEVAALGKTQERFHETSQKSIQQVAGSLSMVSDSQESLKAGLVVSNKTSAKIAEDVTALGQKQSQVYDAVQSNNSRMGEKISFLEQGQSSIITGIADSRNQTLKLSSELAALGDKQAKFMETSGNSISDIVNNLSLIVGNQEVLKAALAVAHNDTAGIANSLSQINQNQEVLKAGLVLSSNGTAGVSNRVASLDETQKELRQMMQDTESRLSQKVAAIEKNQSDLLNGIKNVKSDAGEIAAEFSAVKDGQTNLRQAVDNFNQQLTDRITVIEKGQKQWQNSIKQMQDNMQQAAGNISTFERNLSKLQDIFQGKIGDLTNASNAGSRGQLEFQEKIKNDLAALSEAVSVIKQSQTQLQQKVEEVQTSTRNMSIEFPAAIEQLKKDIDAKKETEYSSDK